MELSNLTRQYVEALIREGDDFDSSAWFWKMKKEKAEAEAEAEAKCVLAEDVKNRSESPEGAQIPVTSHSKNPCAISSPTFRQPTRLFGTRRCQSDPQVRRETQKDRLKRRLAEVCEAWNECHESRRRDAVYPYLSAVFEMVEHYKIRRRTERLKRLACAFSGIAFDKNADSFSTVIRCTCEKSLDNKTISKWTRSLRYVAKRKRRGASLQKFMKRMGGINACAGQYAKHFGRGGRRQ